MKRRGTLYELIKSQNPDLADSIRRGADSARLPSSLPNRPAPPAALGTSKAADDLREPPDHRPLNTHARYNGPATNERPIVDAYIGLDFGTSCSKVVIRLPDERRLFAVPFGRHGHPSNPYLLPSVVWRSPGWDLSLQPASGSLRVSNLKMGLLAPSCSGTEAPSVEAGSISAEVGCAAYLAQVMKLTQAWFNATHGITYGTGNIRWWCNLGVPAHPYSDNEVCQRFAVVAHAAWTLQDKPLPLTIDTIEAALSQCQDGRPVSGIGGDHSIQIIPEVLAAVGGHIKSGVSRDGPHILMDVGAGTLDMCSFRIVENRGDLTCIMLSTSIAPLGSISLERMRTEALIKAVEHCAKSDGFALDPVRPIRSHSIDYLPTSGQLTEIHNEVSAAEIQFGNDCGAELQQIWKALRDKRDPNYRGEIHFVLCGGGCGLPVYNHLIDNIKIGLREHMNYGQLQRVELRTPANLASDLPDDQLHRYSVAVGLSYPALELGRIIPPPDVPDVLVSPRPDWGASFVSKDQV